MGCGDDDDDDGVLCNVVVMVIIMVLQGYVKRQALYACNTCTPKGGVPAGICLACSYKCHEGHELFELYTKR